MWCWLVVTFWSLAYASKQSDEVLNKAKPFKDFGATWNKAWTILVLGLSEICCACLHLNQHYQSVREPRIKEWEIGPFPRLWKATLVEKQLGQLWWKGQCGVGCKGCWAGVEELLPSLCSGWAPCWGSGMFWKLGMLQPLALAEPRCREMVKRQNEMLLESVCV